MHNACKFFFCLVMLLAVTGIGGCCRLIRQPNPDAALYADLKPAELRDVLAALARSHAQKAQLVFYVSLPWTGVDPSFRSFYDNMGAVQNVLYKEIHAWADAHDIDLTFSFSPDIMGQAQELMEARQQKLFFSDNRTDLTRDTLILMWADHEFQISILQNLLPKVHELGLKTYLEHSLKVHTQGSAELTTILKRYKAP